MTTKITLLVDNKAQEGLKKEHGFAVFIESQGKRILFDSGQNNALFYNAEKLNISLVDLDAIILSHGHYDHGGNLVPLLKANPNASFYAHPDCKNVRYSLHPNNPAKTISLSRETIDAINAIPTAQSKMISKTTEILPGIWLTGQIPRISRTEDTGGPFFLDQTREHSDLIHDDMSLWIETEKGISVICGCCHAGITNTLEHIQKQNNEIKPIKLLLGGLHLVSANPQRLSHTINYLNSQNIEKIYPAHCTGEYAMKLLGKEFINEVEIAKAGLKIALT